MGRFSPLLPGKGPGGFNISRMNGKNGSHAIALVINGDGRPVTCNCVWVVCRNVMVPSAVFQAVSYSFMF